MFRKLYTKTYSKAWLLKTQFRNNAMQFVAVSLTEHSQQTLALHLHSTVRGGSYIVTGIFAHNSGQYLDYE